MPEDKVAMAVGQAIIRVTRDIKKKKGVVGSDKLNSLSKLVNAYNRLLERTEAEQEPESTYYDQMVAEVQGSTGKA